MPDVNALTYAVLRTAVLGRRFPAASQTTNANRWLASAYQDVWSAQDDWTFARVSLENLTVTAGDETPTMPAAYADTSRLFDNQGSELARMSVEEFEASFAAELILGTRGVPEAFTVINRQITLAPIPQSAATFKHSYRRRMASKTTAGVVQAGFMAVDTDYPVWDDHHAVLIPRAQAIGLQELSDPTWQLAQTDYERQLDRMIDDYGVKLTGQWGDGWDS